NAESIRLEWSAGPETDIAGYTIFRSESAGGPCQTIARNVGSTSFVDNTVPAGVPFFYTIRAVDHSLNRSDYSGEVSATATGSNDLAAHFPFEGNTRDSSINLNHSASYGTISYAEGPDGSGALALNGTDAFLQLPATLPDRQEMTVAAWVYWMGGAPWQRIFEFCNGQDETMYLQPRLRFAIKNGGPEQQLNAFPLPVGEWTHVAVTLSSTGACLYVNGDTVDESAAVTIRPSDFSPVLNYIGRSLFAVPLFNGYIDDFRVYNYALPASEVALISELLSGEGAVYDFIRNLSLWPVPAKDVLYVNYDGEDNHGLLTLEVLDMNGRVLMRRETQPARATELDVSSLPSGIYLLKLTSRHESLIKKFIIRH
ncbi:MAG: T9SS type A sorting domain-containing protein, partial [Bacteroidales bacterium]|nr:T9SS type A sorting domain-containing protein [Bacteroidales bacterium]